MKIKLFKKEKLNKKDVRSQHTIDSMRSFVKRLDELQELISKEHKNDRLHRYNS